MKVIGLAKQQGVTVGSDALLTESGEMIAHAVHYCFRQRRARLGEPSCQSFIRHSSNVHRGAQAGEPLILHARAALYRGERASHRKCQKRLTFVSDTGVHCRAIYNSRPQFAQNVAYGCIAHLFSKTGCVENRAMRLLDQVRQVARVKHLSLSTERC